MLLIVAALLIGGDALPRNLRAHVRLGRAVVVATAGLLRDYFLLDA